MKKPCRNQRQIIVKPAPAEPQDAQRNARLVGLLATGLERLLSQKTSVPKTLDFHADVEPNVQDVLRIANTENK